MRASTACFARPMLPPICIFALFRLAFFYCSCGLMTAAAVRAGRWSLLQAFFSNSLELGTGFPLGPGITVCNAQRHLKERVAVRDSRFHVPVRIVLIRRLVIAVGCVFPAVFNGSAIAVQRGHAHLGKTELIGAEVKTLFRFRLPHDLTTLLRHHIS